MAGTAVASAGDDPHGFEPLEPALEAGLVGEQDEERIVARERALLLVEGRLVDRLGDDAGGAGRAGQDEDQPAPADRDRDVGEDPPQPLVGGRVAVGADVLGRDVDVPADAAP